MLVLFILKGAKLVQNGFGTWPLLFHFGPCWENRVQVPNVFNIILVLFILEEVRLVPKRVLNLFSAFPLWYMLQSLVLVPNPLKLFWSFSF
jgi:hypothetical protein